MTRDHRTTGKMVLTWIGRSEYSHSVRFDSLRIRNSPFGYRPAPAIAMPLSPSIGGVGHLMIVWVYPNGTQMRDTSHSCLRSGSGFGGAPRQTRWLEGARGGLDANETESPALPRYPMALYGYARVSTFDQNRGIQRAALKAAGCDVIRAEKASGTRRDGRTELQVLLDFLRPGDALVVTRIDRLARSLRDLQNIVHELKERRVTLRALLRGAADQYGHRGRQGLPLIFLACSPNSKPTCGRNARRKASPQQRHVACTRAGGRRSMPRSSASSAKGKNLALLRLRDGSALAAPASIACLGRRRHSHAYTP